MSVTLHRITYINHDLGAKGEPVQRWFPTLKGAMSHIRIEQEADPDFSPVVEEFNVPTGGRQLARWLNENCNRAVAVTSGPSSVAA